MNYLTPAQQADLAERRRDGRPDIAAMTSEERRQAGLMIRRQAVEHERLASVPQYRLAERLRGPDPDDIWVITTDRRTLLALLVDDPPRRDDPEQVQEAKAVAAVEAMTGLLQQRGERVTFGGVMS